MDYQEENITEINSFQEGKAHTSKKGHFIRGNTAHTFRVCGLVRTATGAVVQASDVKAICNECGEAETEFFRCCRCRRVLCPICVRHIKTAEGVMDFCNEHLAEHASDMWRTLRGEA